MADAGFKKHLDRVIGTKVYCKGFPGFEKMERTNSLIFDNSFMRVSGRTALTSPGAQSARRKRPLPAA